MPTSENGTNRLVYWILGALITWLALAALACLLCGCRIYSSAHPHQASHRKVCAQALKYGWCYDDCRRKPPRCCEPKNVRCGPSGLCSWEGCDGSLVFGIIR